jgi:hypothetical protein
LSGDLFSTLFFALPSRFDLPLSVIDQHLLLDWLLSSRPIIRGLMALLWINCEHPVTKGPIPVLFPTILLA